MEPVQTWLAEAAEHRAGRGRPLVTLTYAQSLDGCISASQDQTTILSGPESKRMTHELRALHAAILVGIGTLLADDPRLDVRLVPGANPQPVVLDSYLRTPPNARLLQGERKPWIIASQDAPLAARHALQAAGAQLIFLPSAAPGHFSLLALLQALAGMGIDSLMVEGGAQVISSFLRDRLVDQVVLTIAPRFLGGYHAVEGVDSPHLPRLEPWESRRYGKDLVLFGRPCWDTPASTSKGLE
ncbi:MAG: dihydrofolate reductase family protein [Anaerolineales bacterium]|jgi:GTP cyclohydrolase II